MSKSYARANAIWTIAALLRSPGRPSPQVCDHQAFCLKEVTT
ncbi:MAG: hypothetical protein PHH58_04510 [Rhodoferax sp.]|nr:hypothetical protein [Rhodoferax sp.]